MRILIFHGYLLGGTGSNVYNARLAAALVELGHEVHLLSQDRHPQERPFVDATGDWDQGSLRVRELRPRVSCTVYRPNIGALLPVYVADRYEGIEARTFADCSDLEVARYIDANVAAVRELRARVLPELALANHLVMGPVILARGLEREVPYAVKVHGSALEYTVKPAPERFLGFAREGLVGARAILVGSRHTAASLWQALGDPELPERTRLGPPGVDVARFAPREPRSAATGVRELAARLGSLQPTAESPADDPGEDLPPGPDRGQLPAGGSGEDLPASVFARDPSSAAVALERLHPPGDRLVAFVGKLIVSKGADLLLAAWPLVLELVPRARLVIVGFGAYRAGLESLHAALLAGDLERARAIAARGRALEDAGAGPRPLAHLLAFLQALSGEERARYQSAARALGEAVVFTGRLEHHELAELLPACEALVTPSTFPEAFGMVAVEAAACGALPISAAHSGLAEVSEALAGALPADAARLLSFPVDDQAVPALASRVSSWLQAPPELRLATRAALAAAVRERWSWEGVARGVIAAALGQLERLQRP
jgi:glycosyltransferase involved in cell wall biosynthesis